MIISTLLSFIFGGGQGTKISVALLFALSISIGTILGLKTLEIHGLNSKIEKLNGQNAALISTNAQLNANIKTLHENQQVLIDANSSNQDTIKSFELERAQSKSAIANLAAKSKQDQKNLNELQNVINIMMHDPKNDGTVSPILVETIKQIQGAK